MLEPAALHLSSFQLGQSLPKTGLGGEGNARNLLVHLAEKILLLQPLTFGGIAPRLTDTSPLRKF